MDYQWGRSKKYKTVMEMLRMPEMAQYNLDRFWTKVSITANPNICWNWTSCVKSDIKPYGFITIRGKNFAAHRISYWLQYKKDPKELHVLHRCDNHRCVNPNHLFLGTNADNIADKVSKGRQAKGGGWKMPKSSIKIGSANLASKLKEKEVVKIRKEYATGTTSSVKLASKYKVSKPNILNIIHRRIWKHI